MIFIRTCLKFVYTWNNLHAFFWLPARKKEVNPFWTTGVNSIFLNSREQQMDASENKIIIKALALELHRTVFGWNCCSYVRLLRGQIWVKHQVSIAGSRFFFNYYALVDTSVMSSFVHALAGNLYERTFASMSLCPWGFRGEVSCWGSCLFYFFLKAWTLLW